MTGSKRTRGATPPSKAGEPAEAPPVPPAPPKPSYSDKIKEIAGKMNASTRALTQTDRDQE